MVTDDRKFKDKWDNMVSIPCPKGHIAARKPVQQLEGRTVAIVTCDQCGHRFDWPVPPKLN